MSSILRPWLRFMSSDQGRTYVMIGSGTAACALFNAFYLPETMFVEKTRKILQMYHNGVPLKPKPNVIDLAAEAMGDMELPENEAAKIRWFTSFGFDPMHKGQTDFRNGAIIGLPVTFSYQTIEDVDKTTIKMYRDKSVPWSSESGVALMNSLILSESAKKFVIAREINSVRTGHTLMSSFAASVAFPFIALWAHSINDKYGLFTRPLALRVSVYAVWTLLGTVVSFAMYDCIKTYYERNADRETSNLGEEYIKGGIEFYSKHLLRNRALRELLGSNGEKTYHANGDLKYLIRKPHEAISARKAFLEEQLKILQREQSEEAFLSKES